MTADKVFVTGDGGGSMVAEYNLVVLVNEQYAVRKLIEQGLRDFWRSRGLACPFVHSGS